MWEQIDKILTMIEKHLGLRAAKAVKWLILIIAGGAASLWFINFVVEKLAELETNLHIHIIPSQINIPSSIFGQLGFAILLTVLEIVVLAGVAFIIAVFLATIGSLVFSRFTTRRIDNVFTELLPIVTKNYDTTPTDESRKILDDATKLSQRWGKSRFNNFVIIYLTNPSSPATLIL
jgi:hypothetical protein